MFSVGTDWNPKQSRLREIIKKNEHIDETIALILEMHNIVHSSRMSFVGYQTFADEVLNGLEEDDFCNMPTEKDETIAWNIWHITRIEDITANILLQDSNQVLNESWLARLNVSIKDTGNAMSDNEIIELSNNLNKAELQNYRDAVGRQTQRIIKNLSASDMIRKINKESLIRILNEGGVLEHPDSIWLLDFWGKKDVSGIILMPVTRHQIVHLNECIKLKQKIGSRKKRQL